MSLSCGVHCTITSKINVTPKGVYSPISKLHSILAVANLLAHNNISQICYCGQISLRSAAVNCSFPDYLTPSGVTFILLAVVHHWHNAAAKQPILYLPENASCGHYGDCGADCGDVDGYCGDG